MSKEPSAFESALLRRLARMSPPERAALRRSLAFPPGEYIGAMGVVEPYVANMSFEQRAAVYLFAGLYADIERVRPETEAFRDDEISQTIGVALRVYLARGQNDTRRPAVERRLLTVLDSELDGLKAHLRPLLRLMSTDGVSWSWARLMRDLKNWNNATSKTQLQWAKDFYRVANDFGAQEEENNLKPTVQED